MTDNLTLDGATLQAVAMSLDVQATNMPLGAPLALSNCQSNAVIAAANSFNLWAALNELTAQHAIQQSSTDVKDVAVAFGEWDSQLAHLNQGMI